MGLSWLQTFRLPCIGLLVLAAALLAGWRTVRPKTQPPAPEPRHLAPLKGEFGSSVDLLSRNYTPPQEPGESNYYIDIHGEGAFRKFARASGLTNNRTLFVISHGRAALTRVGLRYVFYPDEKVVGDAEIPYYSAGDLARILGATNAGKIHNLVIAGCNGESQFNADELHTYFLNATNITHSPPGKNGFDIALRHALLYHSREIKMLYEVPVDFTVGLFEDATRAKQNDSPMAPYIASLYKPGSNRPFKKQTAGRELLDQHGPPVLLATFTTNSTPARLEANAPRRKPIILRSEKLTAARATSSGVSLN